MTPDPETTWGPPPAAPPLHPQARTAMILGIISVLGVFCILPVLAGPFAWYHGAVARRAIERDPTRWGGRNDATIGMVCGIIGTALLALSLVIAALLVGGFALLLSPRSGYGS